MSNYDLQRKLSSLQSELRRLEEINAELRYDLSTIANGVSNANSRLESYNNHVRGVLDNCNNIMISSHNTVLAAIETQALIDRMYKRFKNIELAHKKIRACNNKKYYDFANYRTVRKIVQGIMDNLDVRMVSDSTITKSIEVQHLQTPDFWLTCALLSIMAWRNDDRELADRAMAMAVKLDKKNSAVFYMLFNIRMGREEAALKWFYTYQECELKGSDQRTFLMLFSLIAKTLSDSVDEKTRNEIFSFIKQVINANMKSSGYDEKQIVSHIRHYFNRMQPSDHLEYTMLAKSCKSFPEMRSVMMSAKNNINILEFILNTVNVPAEEKNVFIKNFIDELIARPNSAEKDVYDEIEYNELIIKLEGDVEAAKEQYSALQTKKENELNLIAEMIDWIFEKDNQDINGQIRLNMFTLTKQLHLDAVKAHAEAYRSRIKATAEVTLGDYRATVNFKKEDDALSEIRSYYTSVKESAMKEIKSWPAFVGFGLGAAAAVGAFFVGLPLLIATAGGAAYGAFVLISNKSKKKHLMQKCNESIAATSANMQKLFGEYREYCKELDEYDAYYERIINEFDKI